jgi:hypothetical protein
MTRATPIPDTVTLHIPFRIVKRGGRKEMRLPEGAALPRQTDNALVKALARAFRWKRMLESGEFTTIAELAEREGIAVSYLKTSAWRADFGIVLDFPTFPAPLPVQRMQVWRGLRFMRLPGFAG